MLKLTLALTPEIRQVLVSFIETMVEFLQEGLALYPILPEGDEELAEAWEASLYDALEEDCGRILSLVAHANLEQETLEIDEAEAESFLRACSAIRLKMQMTLLANIPEEQLEEGDIDAETLTEQEHKALVTYTFLAGLQEFILTHLDPSLE